MEMLNEVKIRNADYSDIGFVVETIIEAEKGNSKTISYCNLFNISEVELRSVLRKIIEEGISNFEFSLTNFKIAELNSIPIGAYAGWIECKDEISSGFLKINAFKSFLSKQNLIHYKSAVSIVDEINIKRQPGTIQLESLYVLNQFRGKNIGQLLVHEIISGLKTEQSEKVHVQLIKQNLPSLFAHIKYGFQIIEEKTSDKPEILNYFSGNTRVLLQKKQTDGKNT